MVSRDQFLDTIAQEQGYGSYYGAVDCGEGQDVLLLAFNRLWEKYDRNIGIDYEMSKIRAIMDDLTPNGL
jgi:hypothetical protein